MKRIKYSVLALVMVLTTVCLLAGNANAILGQLPVTAEITDSDKVEAPPGATAVEPEKEPDLSKAFNKATSAQCADICAAQVASKDKQIADAAAALEESNELAFKNWLECHPNGTRAEYDAWLKQRDNCPEKPVVKKPRRQVYYCDPPSVKVGNSCECDGRTINGYKPIAVKVFNRNRPWEVHVTCTYDQNAIKSLDDDISDLCGPPGESENPRCVAVRALIVKVAEWYHLLVTPRNHVPAFDRDAFEAIWNAQLDHEQALCNVCGCKAGESAAQACARYRKEDAAHEAAQDEAIRQLSLFRPGWFIGPSVMGVYRGEAPASFDAGLKIGFHSPVSENVVLAASGLFGYAKSREDRFLAGGEFEGFLALNDAKSVSLVFGALGTAEVVYEGVMAWTVPAKLGVGFHGESIGGQLFLGAGPTYVSVPNENKGALGFGGVLGGQFYFDLMPHLKYNPPPPPSASVSGSANGSI